MARTTDWCIPGYELKQRIAGGGMSEVFLAVRRADSCQVVVKTAPWTADEQTRARLTKEHRLLMAIDHPNVVRLLDCGHIDDRPYLVLEHIQGRSLRELMVPGRPLSWDHVTAIVQQLSRALAALHARNILHRDVKPENVLLTEDGQVKLIDLSIGTEVAEVGTLTRQDQFLGTADYMAPEQRHRLHIDHRTDQYSLAAVVFELLTGHCCLGQLRRPSELNSRLPIAVDEVLLRALDRDPDDRFDSVECFSEALLAAGRQHGTRRRLAAAVCGGAILMGILITGIGYVKSRERPPSSGGSAIPMAIHAGSFKPEVITNSLGMKLVGIPGGSFQMGASTDELKLQFGVDVPRHIVSETPQHTVNLTRSFWLGMHEVSVEQFRVFVEETGYQTTSEKWAAEHGRLRLQPFWNDPARFATQDDMPVTAVSWEDAVQFCKWLSDREGVTYRLPTEAEWESACRADTTGPWCCEEGELAAYAVLSRLWYEGPCPIGQRLPNAWGLHDMHGNVWEWCQDYFTDGFNAASATDPVCSQPSDARGYRVLRGGAYKGSPRTVRSTSRRGYDISEAHADRGHAIGFRVACDALPARLARRSP